MEIIISSGWKSKRSWPYFLPAEVAPGQVRLIVATTGIEPCLSHPGQVDRVKMHKTTKTQPCEKIQHTHNHPPPADLAGVQSLPSSSLKGHRLNVASLLAITNIALSLALPFSILS